MTKIDYALAVLVATLALVILGFGIMATFTSTLPTGLDGNPTLARLAALCFSAGAVLALRLVVAVVAEHRSLISSTAHAA